MTSSNPASQSAYFATGFAMFAMFFGAGNVVFPLVLGALSGEHVTPVLLGLMLTGILLPILGLISMILFDGHYRSYLGRIGAGPGFAVALLIMAIIGPFAAIPRTVTLSFSTLELSFTGMPFLVFNALFCAVVFVLAYRRDAVVRVLGYWLTPILLILLCAMLLMGFIRMPVYPYVPSTLLSNMQEFLLGAQVGYNTLDVLAAIVFATVVVTGLKAEFTRQQQIYTTRSVLVHVIKASILAGVLLLVVYGGLCVLAAVYHQALLDQPADHLLGLLSLEIFGPYAGILVNGVVTLACLTTAIALTSVFADFLNRALAKDKDHYVHWLAATTVTTFIMSFLGFEKIVALIFPVLQICYPFIIVLALCNLAYKLWGFTWVKLPVAVTFLLTLAVYVV